MSFFLTPRHSAALLALLCLSSPLASAQEASPLAGERAMAELAALDETAADRRAPLPSLPYLFERALQYDAQLSRQRYEFEASQQELPMARARLLPQVSASGGYLWQDSTNIQTDPEGFGLSQPAQRPGRFDENYWRLNLQQPLFSLERWRSVERANAQVSAAELDLALAERNLALTVSEAFINAYLASRTLGLLEAQQEALELQVRQASRAFDLGVGNRINLLEAQSRFDQAIADAMLAENELSDALGELERLTGILPAFGSSALGNLRAGQVQQEWSDEHLWLGRVGNNLDVLRALAERQIIESDTRVRRGGYFPEVNLNLSYSDRDSDDQLRTSEDYSASVEVNVPLYRGGHTTASVRQGELRTQASQQAVDHAANLAAQEVRQRLRSLNGNVRRLAALEQAIASSELFLQAAERGEQLGLRDLVDVLDARATLYDQRIQYVNTIGRFMIDRLALKSAVGDLGSDDLAEVMSLLVSISTP